MTATRQWRHQQLTNGMSVATAGSSGSAMAAVMAVAAAGTAVLPPHAAAVAMKTLVTTAMVGTQTIINNQLKLATAMETARMTATGMKVETKARWWRQKCGCSAGAAADLAAAAAWQERGVGGGSQLGAGGGSLARTRHWQWWQRGSQLGGRGGSLARA